MLAIVNAGAEAYRARIPADCWHEPYMSADELAAEILAGVHFVGCERHGALVGIMGLQPVRDVLLIRHAYVLPAFQGRGIGGVLMQNLRGGADRQVLVGTWAAASWAIRFYERHGFRHAPDPVVASLLRTFWTVAERQIETSVVLAAPRLTMRGARALIASSGG